MIENQDYVTMQTYLHDMEEAKQSALQYINHFKKERDELKKLVCILTKNANAAGRIAVPADAFTENTDFELTQTYNAENMTYIFTAMIGSKP